MRYCSHTGQNTAKTSIPGALEAKPEVEIWRKPVFPTQRPRLPIRLRILYGVYLAPLRLHRERILTLAHFRLSHAKMRLIAFFSNFERTLFELHESDFFLNLRIDSRLYALAIGLKFPKSAGNFSRKSGPKCKPAKIHISPEWGAIAPEQKLFLSGSLGPKSPRVRWGKGAPQGGELEKVTRPQKLCTHFFELRVHNFFLNFRDQRGCLNLKFPHGRFRPPDP